MPLGAFAHVATGSIGNWLNSTYLDTVMQKESLAACLCAYAYCLASKRPKHIDEHGLHLGSPRSAYAHLVDSPLPAEDWDPQWAAVYASSDTVHVAFRGTVDARDVHADLQLVQDGGWEELHNLGRFKAAICFFRAVVKQYPRHKCFVYGHSLGGTQAMVVALEMPDQIAGGCIFNPGSGALGQAEYAALGFVAVAGVAGGGLVASAVAVSSTAAAAAAAASAAETAVAAASASWAPTLLGYASAAALATTEASAAAAAATAAAGAAAGAAGAAAAAGAAGAGTVGYAAGKYTKQVPRPLKDKMKAYHVMGDLISATFPFKDITVPCSALGRRDKFTKRHALDNFVPQRCIDFCNRRTCAKLS
jgi:pimeloyl-ACP methyl ester carboxylesterase